ncbi:MAG TPA: SRPBCC family protein [Candidatus Dormibacteraeota bacterium]|jgi:uncharacterized membrane protein|nr:SRPBCC family protein [Candidatus Dormibacteraeota bacterium]
MSHLVLSREIFCPLENVFAYVSDLTRAPEWWPNLSEVRRLDGDGPIGVGTRFSFTYNMFGRHFPGEATLTEFVPNERGVLEAQGQIHAIIKNDYRATAKSRTRVTVIIEYEVPGVLGKVVNALIVERRNAADADHAFDQLKDVLEHDAIARIDEGVVL